MSDEKMKWARALKDARFSAGIATMKEAAELCGVTEGTYSRWEAGIYWPNTRMMRETVLEIMAMKGGRQ